jgi:hypothetical protein
MSFSTPSPRHPPAQSLRPLSSVISLRRCWQSRWSLRSFILCRLISSSSFTPCWHTACPSSVTDLERWTVVLTFMTLHCNIFEISPFSLFCPGPYSLTQRDVVKVPRGPRQRSLLFCEPLLGRQVWSDFCLSLHSVRAGHHQGTTRNFSLIPGGRPFCDDGVFRYSSSYAFCF